MIQPSHLKIGTVSVLLGIVGLTTFAVIKQQNEIAELDRLRGAEAGDRAETQTRETSLDDYADADADQITGLATGIIGRVPRIDELPKVKAIPWTTGQINRQYAAARPRHCQLLVAGVPVTSDLIHRTGTMATVGRTPVLSIDLELDPSERNKMPSLTRKETEKYFQQHRLVIEPILYHDEKDHVYFGTDCRAAFFEKQRPLVTVAAEPMIGDSVGKFLALGLLQEGNRCDGRTLLMSFRYSQQGSRPTELGGKNRTTELLVLHLHEDSTPSEPRIELFVTTDNREMLHRLNPSPRLLVDPQATIRAKIRFDKYVMMGMYPAIPVVTDVDLQTSQSIPVAILRTEQSLRGDAQPSTLQSLLDRYDELAAEIR